MNESNCIISGSPWSFACLVQGHLIRRDGPIAKQAVSMFTRYKNEIMSHGYMADRCFRCDESILLPSLHGLGMSNQDSLFRNLLRSLKEKQQPDGSWLFCKKRSAWYTIEAVAAIQTAETLEK